MAIWDVWPKIGEQAIDRLLADRLSLGGVAGIDKVSVYRPRWRFITTLEKTQTSSSWKMP